ncbi:MAG: N-6 DNA methylase [Gemmiger formicilis]|uniref:N-6 DNA methylase n=1 Tax=Gemmiger formicilis TaxID=745368 RepID=UPI0039A08C61
MAKVVRGIDDYKKEFLRLFDSLCGKYSRWEVWSDFIQLTAIDMSNATDKVNAPKRMETGKTIRKKYRDADMETMGNMLMQLVYGMDADTEQDFLGELYMACNLGNDHAGQFFTPYNVCRCMSEITYDVPALLDGKGFIAVNDPACGAGALLLSFANICKRKGINYQEKVLFVAQDIDYTVGLMCYIQLSLMGCAGYVVIGDTLINPCTAYDKKGLLPAGDPERIWFTPLFSDGIWYGRRLAAQMDLLISGSSRKSPENVNSFTEKPKKVADSPAKDTKKPCSFTEPAKAAAPVSTPVSTKKVETWKPAELNETKNGQLTFSEMR